MTRLLIIFLIWSVIWVLFSDYVLHFILSRPVPMLWSMEGLKAVIYVVATAIILAFVVREQNKESERARLADQSKLRSVQAANLIGIATWSDGGEIIEANDAFLKMLGYSRADLEAGRIRTTELVAPECYQRQKRAREEVLATGRSSIFEEELIRKDGSRVTVVSGRAMIAGHPELRLGYALDITPLKRAREEQEHLEEQLRRTQQLNSLGQLAGGISHDFNNLLGVIIGYSALIESELAEDDPRRESITEVLKAAERGRNLVRSLLKFGQKDIAHPELLDVNKTLSEMEKILHRATGENVAVRLELGEHIGRVLIDNTQFEQIVMNLVVNARDAMPAGGVVTIQTGKVHVEPGTEHLPKLKRGDYVVIKVKDTGMGIDGELRKRIFEPFFSTKKHAGGTGLGLAIVYGAVQQNGGEIQVESQPGHGAEFRVYLPSAAEHVVPAAASPAAAAGGGSTTILLIEDDAEMRNMLSFILRGFGYTVLPARDGQHGVEIAIAHGGPIDLILTDVAMPRLSGPDAVEQIRNQRPGVKVLVMTGFAEPSVLEEKALADAAFLEKPVTPETLARKIREILGPGTVKVA